MTCSRAGGSSDRAGHEVHVDPRVHLETGGVRAGDRRRERIETGLRRQRRRARLESRAGNRRRPDREPERAAC